MVVAFNRRRAATAKKEEEEEEKEHTRRPRAGDQQRQARTARRGADGVPKTAAVAAAGTPLALDLRCRSVPAMTV